MEVQAGQEQGRAGQIEKSRVESENAADLSKGLLHSAAGVTSRDEGRRSRERDATETMGQRKEIALCAFLLGATGVVPLGDSHPWRVKKTDETGDTRYSSLGSGDAC